MQVYRHAGMPVQGMKPVASGAVMRAGQLVNDDAASLRAASSVCCDARVHNPYVFGPPTAPHLAAASAGVTIRRGLILDAARALSAHGALVVEGVGGWQVPIGPAETMADVARDLGLPVVLVVGLRLGCLNHALLTAETIKNKGFSWAGWVANGLDPELPRPAEWVDALAAWLDGPPLFHWPWFATEAEARSAHAEVAAGLCQWIMNF